MQDGQTECLPSRRRQKSVKFFPLLSVHSACSKSIKTPAASPYHASYLSSTRSRHILWVQKSCVLWSPLKSWEITCNGHDGDYALTHTQLCDKTNTHTLVKVEEPHVKINEPLLLACFKIDTFRFCVFSLNGIAGGLVAFKTRLDIINADEMKTDRGLDISCFHRQRFISTGIIHSHKGSELLLRMSCRRLSCLWVSLNPLAHRDYDQYWWRRTLDQTDPRFSSCRTSN